MLYRSGSAALVQEHSARAYHGLFLAEWIGKAELRRLASQEYCAYPRLAQRDKLRLAAARFHPDRKPAENLVGLIYPAVIVAVVGGKVGEAVVGAYKKVEDAFVGTFMAKEGESVEDAKARLSGKEEK